MSLRRMLPFLLLNIVVSATVVLLILWWWDGRNQSAFDIASTLGETAVAIPTLPTSGNSPELESEPTVDEAAHTADDAAQQPVPEEPSEQIHVVQAGDTLGRISLQYGVTMDEIMAANDMSNANFLFVGQQLLIPEQLGGIPTPVPDEPEMAVDNEDNTPPTPIPTIPAGEGSGAIGISSVTNGGQLATEAVEIVNNGSSQIDLNGWQLADQFGHIYTFDQITLFGDGAGIQIYSTSGPDSATALYWGADEALWQSGKLVQLYDAERVVQAEFTVP